MKILLNIIIALAFVALIEGLFLATCHSQDLPPMPPGVQHQHKIRTWAKSCPLCGGVTVSTNHHWGMTTKVERSGNVQFVCTNDDCEGLQFWEEIRQPFPHTNAAPMIEITR